MLLNDDIDTCPIKIIDFGLATLHDPRTDPPMTAFAGSAFTVAPEVVKRRYGKECDMWSVGVITYFLLTQKMPFNCKADADIFRKIVSGDYGYPKWAETGISEEAKDFIDALLVVDPKRRLTAKQGLTTPWIRKHNERLARSVSNAYENLALVPVNEEKAIVVRREQPHRPPVRRGNPQHYERQRAQPQQRTPKSSAAPKGAPRRVQLEP